MIFNCLGIYYVTYSGSTAPCKKMPFVIYCCTAVTVPVLKAWINAELMVGSTAAKLLQLFLNELHLLTLYTHLKVFWMLFFSKKKKNLLSSLHFFSLRRIVGLRQSHSIKNSSRVLSYMGNFTRPYHLELLNNSLNSFIRSLKVRSCHSFVERVNCDGDELAS